MRTAGCQRRGSDCPRCQLPSVVAPDHLDPNGGWALFIGDVGIEPARCFATKVGVDVPTPGPRCTRSSISELHTDLGKLIYHLLTGVLARAVTHVSCEHHSACASDA
jgi:hypothetical protein